MRMLLLVLPLLHCWPTGSVRAQQRLHFDHLTLNDGLSQNNIRDMLQDKKGFMWFATQDGLNRYDGYRFTVYRNEPNNKHSLSVSGTQVLCEESETVLWVGTIEDGGGLNRFHTDTERAEIFRHDPANPQSISDNNITALHIDPAGQLWVGTFGGLNRYDARRKTFRRFGQSPANTNRVNINHITSLMTDRQGQLWVGTLGGLFRFTPQTGQFTPIPLPANAGNGPIQPAINRVYADRAGTIWVCTADDGLFRLRPDGQEPMQYRFKATNARSLSHNRVFDVREDRRGQFWVATQNGLNVLNRNTGLFTRHYAQPGDKHGLLDNRIGQIYEDREGVLWFVDPNINRYDPRRQLIQSYYPIPGDPRSLKWGAAGIAEDAEGRVWAGDWSPTGLKRLDRKTGILTYFPHDPANPNSVADFVVPNLWMDPGTLWAGTKNGLSRLDIKTGRFTNYRHDPANPYSPGHTDVRFVYRDRPGRLWVGTGNSLDWLDEQTSRFYHLRHDPSNPKTLSGNHISYLFEDSRHTFWVGTFGSGLHTLDRKTGQFTRYRWNPGDSTSQFNESIYCITEDKTGNIWLGGPRGMSRLDQKTGRFRHYTTQDGLPNVVVMGILVDDHNRLWVSTNRGIARLDQRTGQFAYFTPADGLPGWEFNGYGFHKNPRTGEFFFGGTDGLTIFHPDSIGNNRYVPPMFITGLRRFVSDGAGLRAVTESVLSRTDISLPHDAGPVTIEFAALSYSNPVKNSYTYQLQGFSNQWIPLGTKPEVTLAGLSPGTYTLQVKGANGDGFWNETPAQFTITILPPWWQTGWAWLGYALLVGIGLWIARRTIVNRERLRADLRVKQTEAESLRELDGMKSRFFANLSHEFRTPLALISGIVQKRLARLSPSDDTRTDYGLIARQANRLLQLINQLLDLSRLEARQLHPHVQPGNLTALLRALAGSFESLAQSKEVTYRYALPLHSLWAAFDADKVEKIVTNLLGNAVKFTPAGGQIAFTADRSETTIRLVVQDTGIGIASEHLPRIFDRFYQADPTATRTYEGAGIGLALTNELVQLLGGSIAVDSQLGIGSTFTVSLPLTLAAPPEQAPESAAKEDEGNPQSTPLPQLIAAKSRKQSAETVLLIEDNTDLRQFIHQCLAPHYTVLEAVDGLAGLHRAMETIPDLIISDVMMPGLDGLTLCGRLKSDERTSHIPVILLTAKADTDSKLTGLDHGADDYLTKPFQLDELQARIRNLIRQRQQLRERFSRHLTVQPADVTVTSADERFLQRALALVEKNMSNSDFDVDVFSREMALSRTQLYRKLSALTDQAPTDFIRQMRLRRAADLLRQQHGNVSEIALQVGFNSLNYFTRCFREEFGQTPSEYAKGNG